MRSVLGLPVAGAFTQDYCGGGVLAACRETLWASLEAAAAALETEFSSPNVSDWRRQVADEDVRHTAVGVTAVPAIHWINRPTFQQVVQVNPPQPAGNAFGAGALKADNGKKIGFAFYVEALSNGDGDGFFALDDPNGNKTIDVRDVSKVRAPAGAGCGAVPAGGAGSVEITGTGQYKGAGNHTVKVCAQDNGTPGKNNDKLHVVCVTCPYNTSSPYTTEVLHQGNIVNNVTPVPPPGGGGGAGSEAPAVVSLEPVFGGLGPVTAVVYNAAGQPLSGVPVTLTGVGALPLTAVSNALGQVTFLVNPLLSGTATATAGGVESNPVRIAP